MAYPHKKKLLIGIWPTTDTCDINLLSKTAGLFSRDNDAISDVLIFRTS